MGMPDLPIGTHGEVNVIFLPNGSVTAECRICDVDGKVRRVQRTSNSAAAAKNKLREAIRDRVVPVGKEGGISGRTRFDVLADKWLKEFYDSNPPSSTKSAYTVATRQLKDALGGHKLSQMTVACCEKHLQAVASLHPTKAKRHRTVLSAQLGIAVRHGVLSTNPIREVGGMKKPTRKPVYAPDNETIKSVRRSVRLYFDACDASKKPGPRMDRVLIDVLGVSLFTGARIGEVLALRWEDIDFAKGQISFRGTIVTIDKTADPDLIVNAGRQEGLKGGKASRTIWMPPVLQSILLDRSLRVEPNAYDAVFANRNGRFYPRTSIHGKLAKFREYAGLPPNFSFHSPRKSVGTLLASTDSAQTAAAQLGNSVNIAREYYIQEPEAAPDSSAAIQEAFGQPLG